MTTNQCAVSVSHVGTPHDGDVRLYRSAASTGRWMVCAAHAEGAPARGINWLVPVDVDADHDEAIR